MLKVPDMDTGRGNTVTLSNADKRQRLMGHRVKCDVCGLKNTLHDNWRHSRDHDKICPNCAKDYRGVMVNI